MSLFFCGVVFSFPRLRYKNPSTCSIIFRLPLLEKISPNRLVCVFFWVAVIAKLQEEESRFFLLPEGLFFIARHQIEPFLHIYCKIFCRRFVFVLCTKGFCFNHEYPGFFFYFGWHKPHLPSIYSGLLLPRTSLLSFRVLFPAVLWPIHLRVCLLRFPKQQSGETLLLCDPECSETFL